jgi:L-rhamnose mutarotase
MERVCFTFDLYEGAEAEYKKRHDEIWPELVTAIKEAGFANYSLFRRGTQIVAYAEVSPDLQTALGKLGTSEYNAKWATWFEDLIVNLTDAKGRLMSMTEVWHLD